MRKTSTMFALMLAFFVQQAFAQQRTITGKVTSKEDTKGIPGVSVVEVGTTNGTTTDIDGKYSLAVSATAKQIKFSGLGVIEQTLDIGASDVMDVVMAADVQKLGEVVVTALGIKREEKSLGYATQKVTGAEITTAKQANFINSLQGRVAGVNISGSSNIGGSSRILLRGVRSIYYENQPLIVVDGVPIDNTNIATPDQARGALGYDYGNAAQDINPNDIADINVLKGASATALYGSQGANGAVIITTKKGTSRVKVEGKSPIGVTLSYGYAQNKVAVLPEYQNRYGGGAGGSSGGQSVTDFVPSTLYPEVDANGDPLPNRANFEYDGSWGPEMLGQQVYQWDAYYSSLPTFGKKTAWSPHPDNIRDFFETGNTNDLSVALDGGNDFATYRLAYTNFVQSGTFPNSRLQRNIISFGSSLKLTDRLTSSIAVNYIAANGRARPATGYSNLASNFTQWWERQLDMNELKDYKNPDGTQRSWNMNSETDLSPLYWDNPYWTQYENFETDQRDRYFGLVGLSYELAKNVSVSVSAKRDHYSEGRQERTAIGSAVATSISKYSEEVINFSENNYEAIINGKTSLSDDFDLSGLIGVNRQDHKIIDNFTTTQNGLNVPNYYNLTNSNSQLLAVPSTKQLRRNSVYASASLGYKRFLYLDVTGRNDWSSTLPPENNSYFYPSVGASFVFTELTHISWLSYGKLRASWAGTANDIPPYAATATRPLVTDNFNGFATAVIPSTSNNTGLKPEKTTSQEIGAELFFFNKRISLDITYYSEDSKDVVFPVQQSAATGYVYKTYNAAELTNKGIELALSGTVFKQETGFEWGLGVNYAKNDNLVKKLFTDENGKETESLNIQNAPFAVFFQARPGESYGQIVGYDYAYDANGNHIIDPGTHSYARTSKVVPLGSVLPDFTGGFRTWVSYKGFRLDGLVDFQHGGKLFSLTNTWGKYSGTLAETAEGDIRNTGLVLDGVLQTGVDEQGNPITAGEVNKDTIAAIDHFFYDGGYIIGAADVYDASFVKLREITLTYSLPEKWFKKCPLYGVDISLTGRNLAILHKNVPNIDPESAVSTNNVQGLEGGQLPTERSYGVRVNVTF